METLGKPRIAKTHAERDRMTLPGSLAQHSLRNLSAEGTLKEHRDLTISKKALGQNSV